MRRRTTEWCGSPFVAPAERGRLRLPQISSSCSPPSPGITCRWPSTASSCIRLARCAHFALTEFYAFLSTSDREAGARNRNAPLHPKTAHPLAGRGDPWVSSILAEPPSPSQRDWLSIFGSRRVPATSAVAGPSIEMGIFKRIYDWLLSLFWCVDSPSHPRPPCIHARFSGPSVHRYCPTVCETNSDGRRRWQR